MTTKEKLAYLRILYGQYPGETDENQNQFV
jgi:hypothetical protein